MYTLPLYMQQGSMIKPLILINLEDVIASNSAHRGNHTSYNSTSVIDPIDQEIDPIVDNTLLSKVARLLQNKKSSAQHTIYPLSSNSTVGYNDLSFAQGRQQFLDAQSSFEDGQNSFQSGQRSFQRGHAQAVAAQAVATQPIAPRSINAVPLILL